MSLPKLFPHQISGAKFLRAFQRAILADEMGCLSGDTKIKVARGRNHTGTREYTLREVCKRFHGRWDKDCPAYVKAWDGKELRLHRLVNVLSQGEKEVWELKTAAGYTIKATGDHEFLVSLDGGFKPLSSLRVGTKVFTNGEQWASCSNCQRSFNSLSRRVHSGLCAPCARARGNQSKRTTSLGLHAGTCFDKSGYVMVKLPSHHAADFNGYVRQHVLVMETHLGRRIRKGHEIVHHRNGCVSDNRISNLELLNPSQHAKLHSPEHKKHLTTDRHGNKIWWEPKEDRVVSKRFVGVEDTYDLVMDDPHRNFVAQGFIVHNCGKTYSVLGAIDVLTASNILIVCPASLVLMWRLEIFKCWPEAQTILAEDIAREKKVVFDTGCMHFVIVSYNYLQKEKNVNRLQKIRALHLLVADEAHRIKTWTSSTCRAFMKLVNGVAALSSIWMLTGTPATNSAADYYPYLNIIWPPKEGTKESRWGTLKTFREYFCEEVVDPWSGYSKFIGMRKDRMPTIIAALKDVMLRRTREQVLKNFPPVVVQHIPVEVSAKIVSMSAKVDLDIVEHCLATGSALPSHVATTMKAIGVAKVQAANEWLQGIGEQPVVVFTRHVEVMKELIAVCGHLSLLCVVISGAETSKQKQHAVETFQNGLAQVALVNMSAGRLGHTLTAASLCLFVEHDWSPEVMEQAAGRILRIGQKAKKVQLTYLIADNTIDEAMVTSVARKSKFMREVMGDE